MKSLLVFSALLFALTPASAQYLAVGVGSPIEIGDLSAMEQSVNMANKDLKLDRLKRLGVDAKQAQYAVDQLANGSIEIRPMASTLPDRYGYLWVAGLATCGTLALLKAPAAHPTAWQVAQSICIDDWDGPARPELLTLHAAGNQELLLHGVNKGHGSNLLENVLIVYSLLDGKLVKTLETLDEDHVDVLGTEVEDTTEHHSSFLPMPDGSLEESRQTSHNDKYVKLERRYWHWSAADRHYHASPFQRVTAIR